MLIDLETIKKHLNLDAEYTEDDTYLVQLENVAETLVEKHIDKTFEDIISEEGEIPQPLLHTILLFIANLYDNRESVGYTQVNEIPNTLTYILNMYRDYNNANI
jgi:uncharacterized phage protein (predicted DNA packaging)